MQVTAPTRDDEAAAGLLEHVPWLLQDELKKRGAIFSHADTIDAPWAVRSGEEGDCFNSLKQWQSTRNAVRASATPTSSTPPGPRAPVSRIRQCICNLE